MVAKNSRDMEHAEYPVANSMGRRRYAKFALAILCAIVAVRAPTFGAGFASLIVGPRTPINSFGAGHHLQTMVAADPESADNLIVCGARMNPRTGAAYEGYVYQSNDRGRTWLEVLVDTNSRWVTEESCAFGEGHRAYFAASASNTSITSAGLPAHEYGNLRLYRSPDSGRSWQTIQVDHFMDWTSMAVDVRPGLNRGTVYLFANDVFDGVGRDLPGNRPYLSIRRETPALELSVIAGNWTTNAMRGGSVGGIYPQGTVVLSDGAVITVCWAQKPIKDASGKEVLVEAVAAYATRDGGKTLEGPVALWNEYILSNLAVNKATDELFVAFAARARPAQKRTLPDAFSLSEFLTAEGKLMLATSTDKGRTWSTHSVNPPSGVSLDVAFLASPSIAVNKEGLIGFLWYGQGRHPAFFGISRDGGASISEIIRLTPEERASAAGQKYYIDSALAYATAGSSQLPPYSNALVADIAGAFHPIWCERSNGPVELYTQMISIAGDYPAKAALSLEGLTDVTERVQVREENFRFDHLGQLYAYDVVVMNRSVQVLNGPILAVLPEVKLPLVADNADDRQVYGAASWQLFIPSSGLDTGQATDPREFTFRKNARLDEERFDEGIRPPEIRVYARVP